jgi:hypothetical protein
MIVDLEVSFAAKPQPEATVPRPRVEQVFEEGNPDVDLALSVAIDLELELDARLFALSTQLGLSCRCCHEDPLSA